MPRKLKSGAHAPSGLTWANGTRKLSELIPWEHNPRHIRADQAIRLKKSHDQFHQPQPLLIGPGNEVYDGHQRLQTWKDEFSPDLDVDVRISSRALTEAERQSLVLALHVGTTGDMDWDVLASWEVQPLKDWGFDEATLHAWNDQAANMRTFLEANYAFEPKSHPEVGGVDVNQGDVDQAASTLANQYANNPDYMEVICPDCFHVFYLNKKELT